MAKRVAGIAAVASVCAALAGCAGAPVDQRPVVRIVEAAQPLVAVPLAEFLPSAPELSAALDTGSNGVMGPLVEGDGDMLLRTVGEASATPADCVSAAYRLQKVVYDSGAVQSVASSSWAGGDFDAPPVTGFFGVVQMASVGDAQEFFATLTEKWRRCNGQNVALQQPGHGADAWSRIVDVVIDDHVVSANVLHVTSGGAAASVSRALGLSGDSIVDVEITDPRAAGRPATSVAELILDKISALR